jgi:hypothetical protein
MRNGEFKYDEGTCTGSSQGLGKFEIIGDTIKFKFKNHQISRGAYKANKIKEIEKGIIVDLTVVDSLSREPIRFYSAAIFSEGILLGGKEGGLNGEAELHAAFNQKPIHIEVSFSGYFPIKILIDQPGHYKILAEMVVGGAIPIRETEWIYKLVELDKDRMVMSGFDAIDMPRTLYRNSKTKKMNE